VRFPVAAVFAGIATLTALSLTSFEVKADSALGLARVGLTAAAVCGFVAALAMALAAERNERPWSVRQLVSLAAGLATFLPGWLLRDALDLQLWLFLPALIAILMLAGTSASRDGDAGLWRFNHDLWVGAAFALIAVVLLAGGLSAIIATSGYLLGTPWSDTLVGRVWTVALGFAGPVIWLTQVPPAGGHPQGEGYAGGLISRAIAAIVTYILAPLQLVYAAILHLYAAKIALAGGLPDGELGWMVVSFGIVSVLTALLAFPTRQSGPIWMRLYGQIWPWTLGVPVLLLVLAISERIGAYGWTEPRYLIVLFGVWLAVVILTQGLPTRARSIRLIPALAGAALLLASFGPWGAAGFCERTQAATVVAALREAGALGAEGQLTSWPDLSKLPPASQRRAFAGLDHLMARDRLARLEPVFAGLADSPFKNAALGPYEIGGTLKLRLAINTPMAEAAVQGVGFNVQTPGVIELAPGTRLIGPFTLDTPAKELKATLPEGELIASFAESTVTIESKPGGTRAVFDLRSGAHLAAVEQQGKPTATPIETPPLRLTRTSGALEAELIVTQSWGRREADGPIEIAQVGFWILYRSTD
jgi:hypothetical protein